MESELIEVPASELSEDALHGVVESFVLREGTDYGTREFSLQEKITHVRCQIETGEAKILFDPRTQSIDIVTKKELKNRIVEESG